MKRIRWLPLLILLSLNGCADLFLPDFKLDGLKGLAESFDGLRGIGELFNYPEHAHRSKNADKTSPRHCAASIDNLEKTLCLEHESGMEKHWWYSDANGEKHPLQAKENLSASIDTFEVDRDWQYVAIVSAEEGHPMLAVYNLQDWIRTGKQPSPVYIFNPYPGTVHMLGWANNQLLHALSYGKNGLRFETDGPINRQEAATGVWPTKEMYAFRWDSYSMKVIRTPPPEEQKSNVKNKKKEGED